MKKKFDFGHILLLILILGAIDGLVSNVSSNYTTDQKINGCKFVILLIFSLYCMYKIIRKMGYKGFWFYFTLLLLFPFSLLYLVLNEWPIEKQLARYRKKENT